MSYDDEPRTVRTTTSVTIISAAEGFDAIREFDSEHEIRRDPVIAWRVFTNRAEPVTPRGLGERYIAIEYPDGTVMNLVEVGHPHERPIGTLFESIDDWFNVVQEWWSEFGAP